MTGTIMMSTCAIAASDRHAYRLDWTAALQIQSQPLAYLLSHAHITRMFIKTIA